MPAAVWVQAVATAFLGLVGLWFTHNYRRQIRLKLAERQLDSYTRLWVLTAAASPLRTIPFGPDERRQLYEAMSRWYFDDGDGIFCSPATRALFIGVHANLIGPLSTMTPAGLARELAGHPSADAERRRGCVIIRQASLLRTQLKTDLSIHFGFDHYMDLYPHDRAFLRSCGVSPWRRPWRRRLFRSSDRPGAKPCVCGLCPPRAASVRR